MADESAGGGNSAGFLVVFFGIIICMWFVASGTLRTIAPHATSTGEQTLLQDNQTSISAAPQTEQESAAPLSPDQVQAEVARAQQTITDLKQGIADTKLWGTVSPYKDKITLQNGNVWSDDEDAEYLTLYAASDITIPINVSGWRIESTVTKNAGTIPQGNRKPKSRSDSTENDIMLTAGDTAYIVTGESPIGMSFRENMCTGYFAQFQEFTPSLSQQCPNPLTEMETFAKIALDNDACYDFVETLSSCRIVNADRANVSKSCRTFADDTLSYTGCLKNHQYDAYFLQSTWHIYLDENDDLWRGEREIIRLLDNEDRVVAVLKY